MDRHALIAGVSGIIGRHLAEHLVATEGWTVTGISRHKHDLPKGVKHVAVDLQAGEDVKTALLSCNRTTRPRFLSRSSPFCSDFMSSAKTPIFCLHSTSTIFCRWPPP